MLDLSLFRDRYRTRKVDTTREPSKKSIVRKTAPISKFHHWYMRRKITFPHFEYLRIVLFFLGDLDFINLLWVYTFVPYAREDISGRKCFRADGWITFFVDPVNSFSQYTDLINFSTAVSFGLNPFQRTFLNYEHFSNITDSILRIKVIFPINLMASYIM